MKNTGLIDINGNKIYDGSLIRNLNILGTENNQRGVVFHWYLSGLDKFVWSWRGLDGSMACIEEDSDSPHFGVIVLDVMEEAVSHSEAVELVSDI